MFQAVYPPIIRGSKTVHTAFGMSSLLTATVTVVESYDSPTLTVAYFRRVKWPTRDANHTLPSSAEIESELICNPNRNALMECTVTNLLLR